MPFSYTLKCVYRDVTLQGSLKFSLKETDQMLPAIDPFGDSTEKVAVSASQEAFSDVDQPLDWVKQADAIDARYLARKKTFDKTKS